jgi:spore coat polysaccharide biosynthesis predicted glycosyltransferase SpsG
VVGFGHSLLEAAHLGVPAVAAVFVPEHLEDARSFVRHGSADYVDMTERAQPGDLVQRIRRLLDTAAGREMGRRGSSLVDGRGAARVARAIAGLAA